jgi:integrase
MARSPAVSRLAPILQGFFTDRLSRQRQASPHTVAAYRDSIRLLVAYAANATGKQPVDLDVTDLDAALIVAFLTHLETARGNSVTTRNTRLAAIRSLFRHAALQAPEDAAVIQRVLAIPPKRCDRAIVDYLSEDETAALLAAPDRGTRLGRRDHALLTLAVQTGLRVSELTRLRIQDLHLGPGAHVGCHGQGELRGEVPAMRVLCRAASLRTTGAPFDARSSPVTYAAVAAGCPWWMTSWQGWQTTRVLRRFFAMSAAQAGWPGPGVPRLASLRTWCTITVPGLPHSSHRRARSRRTSSLRG